MYKIMRKGSVIALCDEPRYIRMHENGCYVQTDAEHAEGIAVNSIPYPIGEITVEPCEMNEFVLGQNADIEKTNADILYLSMMTGVDIPCVTAEDIPRQSEQ